MRKRRKQNSISNPNTAGKSQKSRSCSDLYVLLTSVWGKEFSKTRWHYWIVFLSSSFLTDHWWNYRGARGYWYPLTKPECSHLGMHSLPYLSSSPRPKWFYQLSFEIYQPQRCFFVFLLKSFTLERVLMLGKLNLIFCSVVSMVFLFSSCHLSTSLLVFPPSECRRQLYYSYSTFMLVWSGQRERTCWLFCLNTEQKHVDSARQALSASVLLSSSHKTKGNIRARTI